MKSHISINNHFSNKEKSKMREYLHLHSGEMMRRYFKLLCITLNEEYHFGKKRLMKIISRIEKVSNEHMDDEEFWYHIDKRVIEQMGIEFSKEKYEEMK